MKGSTARHYAEMLDRYISPALGDHYVDALTRADVERWFHGFLLGFWARPVPC